MTARNHFCSISTPTSGGPKTLNTSKSVTYNFQPFAMVQAAGTADSDFGFVSTNNQTSTSFRLRRWWRTRETDQWLHFIVNATPESSRNDLPLDRVTRCKYNVFTMNVGCIYK